MTPEEKIKTLEFTHPEISPPEAMYIPVCQLGNPLYVSGQVPMFERIFVLREKQEKKEPRRRSRGQRNFVF